MKSLVMEIVLATILVSIILNTATGHRSIGHNAAIAVGPAAAARCATRAYLGDRSSELRARS